MRKSLIFILLLILMGLPSTAQMNHSLRPLVSRDWLSLVSPFERTYPQTPLPQETLDLLADELSGQVIFNNMMIVAGAPWIRKTQEFTGTLYEAQKMLDLAREYGLRNVSLERVKRDRQFDYPTEAEFWVLEPEKRLVARLDADAALLASGSKSVDISGRLVYIPPMNEQEAAEWIKNPPRDRYEGTIALMWSYPRGRTAKALDEAGIRGIISFSSRERYFDPDQVVYSRGTFFPEGSLQFGMTVSWRQWSELLEDVESDLPVTVRCKAVVESYPDKYEWVYAWIPGQEPDEKGVIFTAHLFEGYVKRGTNDNAAGCVIQLEIMRALNKLIEEGALPRPRRTIHFLWPPEISGTYEFFKQHPDMIEKFSTNINMDMVSEALRKSNALFTMTECPNFLPSYLDGLGDSIMNYIWRTNDIVYLPDSPRGRPGGQYFPKPLWEKNGSRDAFRYYLHLATGGSDHTCFVNPAVQVPGIELNIWPDQWYHADTDTPDKSDPTQLLRTAFIGASMAWTAANCTDEVMDELVDAVSSYGYKRVGKRDLPKALSYITKAEAESLNEAILKSFNHIDLSVDRESGAIRSLVDIDTRSARAKSLIDSRTAQWEGYRRGLKIQAMAYARRRAEQLNTEKPNEPLPSEDEIKYDRIIPSINPDVRAREFSLERSEGYLEYVKEHPDILKTMHLSRQQKRMILNYIDGRRSINKIWKNVMAETGTLFPMERLLAYIEFLKNAGWLT